ncbi:hypothetical protein [Lachnotalea glycerini]|uniref:DUF4872 domain-containing protein n=1 Tax=Lachnotalea glycerini TaxID=1763509 RepID=A0A371JGV6_9FIRM|nr:hypothetical protein [Lachnotalea glycerini]RDY31936.1 hypothetical protein CG710_007265 [Lachnotalea glycerini]
MVELLHDALMERSRLNMNYRECRQGALQEMLGFVDSNISAKKNFLVLGGMRNAMYLFEYHGVKLYGLCGCNEINIPGIFKILDIEFTKIPPEEFWNTYEEEFGKGKNFYLLPVVRDILNVDDADLDNYNLIGHSYFLVNRIENDKIYFKPINSEEEFYLTRKVFNKINNSREWIIESDFEGYCIKKHALKCSETVKSLLQMTERDLLINNINAFLKNKKVVGERGCIRYDGEQVYGLVETHMKEMLAYLEKIKGTVKYDQFMRYVYLQLINFRKMIAAGSDGYYRSEFCDILLDYPQLKEEVEQWENIVCMWRKYGRKLAQVASLKYLSQNAEEGIKQLIYMWNQIKDAEISSMNQLKDKIVLI